ncbi:hypothetical protein [Streptomyces sp. CAU 1734]|uniref:hypothetical protein n=1 Tax=Streptomyces sp. CAU 1734 TaxID=3140360 RepID=UPI0032617043
MKRLVTVAVAPFAGRCALRAEDGPGSAPQLLVLPPRVWLPALVDEHLAVDADLCRDERVLGCADVLLCGGRLPLGEAWHRLTGLTAARPGCRLAAVPLIGGGLLAAEGAERRPVVVPCAPVSGWSLLPSCLHTWLTAGRELAELAAAVRASAAVQGAAAVRGTAAIR